MSKLFMFVIFALMVVAFAQHGYGAAGHGQQQQGVHGGYGDGHGQEHGAIGPQGVRGHHDDVSGHGKHGSHGGAGHEQQHGYKQHGY